MKNIFVVVTQLKLSGTTPTIEKCEVMSKVTNNQHTTATFIIDVVRKKVVKSRKLETNYERIYEYFSKQFPKHASEVEVLLSAKE